jgi:3-oxoacyl-[acyl-carrier-protein] synthase II
MRPRVMVTGAGSISSLGSSPQQLWQRLLRGESGIGLTTLFDTTNFPTRIAAEVQNWSIANAGEDPHRWQSQPRQTLFAIGAAKQAFADAGLVDFNFDPTRLGVYVGCGDVYQDFGQFVRLINDAWDGSRTDIAKYTRRAMEMLDPQVELERQPHMASSHLAAMFNAQGPNVSSFTACAASSQAIGESAELIRRGDADVMLAGGTHSLINALGVTGLSLLTALSRHSGHPSEASRPFDRDRDGFVLGEGAGILVLESLEHAVARGAPIFGEITGYGSAADAYRITDVHPEGRGASTCMQLALDDAQLNPDEIDYINAHGTSTLLNDKVETLAIKRIFGPQAYRTPISSTKSMTGHLLAAAGVTELIVCLMALRDGALPPTINYHTPDEECDLDYVPNEARDARCRHVLSNSFGFGGQNVSLVVSAAGAHRGRAA